MISSTGAHTTPEVVAGPPGPAGPIGPSGKNMSRFLPEGSTERRTEPQRPQSDTDHETCVCYICVFTACVAAVLT